MARATSISPGNGNSQQDQTAIQQTQDDIVMMQGFSKLLPPLPTDVQSGTQPRQIYRVPAHLRLKGKESNPLLEPILVSLGPYHHGEKFSKMEGFKLICLNWCASHSEATKISMYKKILANINEIRGCYAEVLDKYDDEKLAVMMLLDACFIINFMDNLNSEAGNNNFSEWRKFLGVVTAIQFAAHDIILLENQIPFKVLEMIISSRYAKEEGESLLHGFMSWMLSIELSRIAIPNKDNDLPLHLLEACWRVIVGGNKVNNTNQHVICTQRVIEDSSEPTCLSATKIRERGILIRSRPSHSLMDITFMSGTTIGVLDLPVLNISEQTQVILTNLIAYEISPGTTADLAVLSYTKFMKSLVQFSEDVKTLNEKGVLCRGLAHPDQVVEMFKNIDTFGLVKFDIFKEVKHKIGMHCSSKSRTWLAVYIKALGNPWTASGFIMSYIVCVLTFLQTYYTLETFTRTFRSSG